MTLTEAFFTVHCDLPREGPGLPEDVLWTLDVAETPQHARICDAACGPGADTLTLAEARPEARIDAVDLHQPFLDQAEVRCKGHRARFEQRDYTDLTGDYDLIWCAGAAYFKGFETVLDAWRNRLLPGGCVAFSEPAWVSEPPSPEAQAFWRAEGHLEGLPALSKRLGEAGWHVLGQRWLIGAPWAAYYTPMQARLDVLRASEPNETLAAAVDEAQREIDAWRAAPDQIAYSLFVVRPA
ncbi:MAG: class I SAM-dependent methyltransferase [Silicimonas sp.]|nr:class I SAM-dependent methyltransferase [Silicimonas sp.]